MKRLLLAMNVLASLSVAARAADGALVITARKEKWPNPLYKDRALGGWHRQREFADYTSADLQSRRMFHYGRVEFRAQMPRERGAWPALWFLGDCIRQKGDAYSRTATGRTGRTPSASRCSSS